MYSRRILLTLTCAALSTLAACSSTTAPKQGDCSDAMTQEKQGYGSPNSTSTGTNADGSTWVRWYYGSGTQVDPFHATLFTWGGPLPSCTVQRFGN